MKKLVFAVLVLPFTLVRAFELKGSLDTSLNSNSVNPAYDRTISQDFTLNLNTKISELFINLENSVSKEYTQEKNLNYNDPILSFSYPIFNNDKLKIKINERNIFGLSKESRKDTTLLTSINLYPSFTFTEQFLNLKGLSLTYTPTLRKNFFRNQITATGKSNYSWSYSNKLALMYEINNYISFSLNGTYQRSYTYQKNSRDRIIHQEAIGLNFNERLSGEIGHLYRASALSPDGQQYQINSYDSRYSTVYLSFSYGF